jgi:hypothetical protein
LEQGADGACAGNGATGRRLPYLEIVWLPHYRVTFETVRADQRSTVDTLIGGHDRQVTICDFNGVLWDSEAAHETFDPELRETEAPELARRGLLAALLRGRGPKPSIGKMLNLQLVHYPYWAYYYERRGGLLDVKMLDAVTGSPAGPKTKVAFLAALVKATQ